MAALLMVRFCRLSLRLRLIPCALLIGALPATRLAGADPSRQPPASQPSDNTVHSSPDPTEALLRQGDVEPSATGVLALLREWKPDAALQAQIAQWIRQLDDQQFRVRLNALKQLRHCGAAAIAPLRAAINSDVPQIALDARGLVQEWDSGRHRSRNEALLEAALRWLARHPSASATPLLVDLLDQVPSPETRDAATEALWNCASHADVALLTQALHEGSPSIKAAVIPALAQAGGDGVTDQLQPFLKDKDERIRLSAARALIDRLHKPAVDALVSLLDSRSLMIRGQAGWLLAKASGLPRAGPGSGDLTLAAADWKKWAAHPDANGMKTLGSQRLHIASYDVLIFEPFDRAESNLCGAYGRFTYETDCGAKASVSGGVLRLNGDHPEGVHGDGVQRLGISAQSLTGADILPRRFEIQCGLGGEDLNASAWHVGVSVGNVRLLFHPGLADGQFRIERVDNEKYIVTNTAMPFTPAGGALEKMTVDVTRLDDGSVNFDVTIVEANDSTKRFTGRFHVEAADIGPVNRIGLERSGRPGGAGLFGPLTVKLLGDQAPRQ